MKAKSYLYHRLWLKQAHNRAYAPKSSLLLSADELCDQADMCSSTEDYVYTLCNGMIELSKLSDFEDLTEHKRLEAKIKNLGIDVLEKSRAGSELFYLALFMDFKLAQNWLNNAIYKIIRNMFSQIMNLGISFSHEMKLKIIKMYKPYFKTHPRKDYLSAYFNSYLKTV